MKQTLHLAKFILVNHSRFIENGGFLVENSKIIVVGSKNSFGDLTNYNVVNHGESLICSGFINLHAHLLYSKLGQINGSDGLFPWLEQLVSKTKDWEELDYISSIKHGINQALSTGTTFLVENTPNILSAQELSKSSLRALIGIEIFGSEELEAENILNKKLEEIYSFQSPASNFPSPIYFTFSPHATYDVSKPLWERLLKWSNENNKPLLTHLEESLDEKLWWQEKSGPAIKFWTKINTLEPKVKYWRKYRSGIDFLNQNELLHENIIATHLACADKKDLEILRKKNIKLVHCPRSNFYLKNRIANLKLWDELGFEWGMGTDSLASNDDLDLLSEVKFAIQQQKMYNNYNISPVKAFETLTSSPAKILGLYSQMGSLESGKNADFLIYSLENKLVPLNTDPYSLLIEHIDNKKDLKEVWINGSKVLLKERTLNKI